MKSTIKTTDSSAMVYDHTNSMAVNSKTQYAELGKKRIAYRLIGKGEPIILCNRFRGNLDDWDPKFLDLLAENFKVVTFNYTGLASSSGDKHKKVIDFAKDVKELSEYLGFKKIIVGGWSVGGWVAQIVTTEFPEIVSQTILIGTKPPGNVKHQIEELFMQTAFKPYYDLEDEVILFFDPTSEYSRKLAKESHDRIAIRESDRDIRIDEKDWEVFLNAGEDYTNDPYNAREKIQKTNIPMLVISSQHEICFPPENWMELNMKIRSTQIIIIPQTGHGPQHQYPELVTKYILQFIEHNKQNLLAN
ncbi:alpha/beta fold hydrolase [Mariniflexile gromovii]|uniref:Alpha/beta hydrolase n=1 Tax=Mariniflexile gromovii TaxID=362523 RepID=A0ABS4BW73_9FLAO|nr:alpha/beta hydrolase [Mariniflexile gromovii]MBP0904302.1 alpha/beta hydrolase [Mariniflexile gromovii]